MNSVEVIIAEALANGRTTLSEYDSKRILSVYDIPTNKELLIKDFASAEKAAGHLGYPLVLKVCADTVQHKTELGFIELGINNAVELRHAYDRLAPKAHDLGGGVLIQEMVVGSRELVMGMIRDLQFGPCVMFGLGGVLTEALGDVTFRVAPLSDHDSRVMLTEIQGSEILGAIRGMAPVQIDQLSRYLRQLGRIGLDHPDISEIDINPLIVHNGLPIAVDALVVLDTPPSQEPKEKPISGSLKALFEPRSVAVIGASQTPHKAGNDVIKNIMANGFGGKIFLVNPKGGKIMGHQVYPSIQDLPNNIDQAIIILPASATPKAIRSCAAKGVKAVVMAASGFAEVDEKGKILQEETIRAICETGVRAIGPNTSGHISTPHNFTSSFFPLGKVPRGNVSYLAQTGNFATHTMRYIISSENFGVARVLGLGNKLDVEESEVLEYFGQDPETKAILVYLESFKSPQRFLYVARQVTRSKPVILLKGGSTDEGSKAAVAHTAAMASDDRIIDGALRQCGVVRVYAYSHLILAAKALATMPLPLGNRISFLAPSGAMLVCLTDLCKQRWGLNVPVLENKTRCYLQDLSPPYIRMRNPVDIWPAVTLRGIEHAYREGTEAVLKDKNIDAVVIILMLTDETGVPSLDFIIDLSHSYPKKPIYVTFSGERKHMEAAKQFLEPRGVPTFPVIEEPFQVLSILSRCRNIMNHGSEDTRYVEKQI